MASPRPALVPLGIFLAALVNGATLIGIAGWVVFEAVHRIGQPQPIRSGLFLAVAATGLLVNLISLRLLHAEHDHSLNIRAAYLHVMGDMLGSVGAVIAAVIVALSGWTLADPIVSVAIAVLWRKLFEKDGLVNGVLGGLGFTNLPGWITSPQYALGTLILLSVWQFGSSMIIFLAGLKQIP